MPNANPCPAPPPIAPEPAHLRPARCTVLPSRFRNTIHTYADIPAWNRAMSHLLYLGFDDFDQPGAIVVRDLATDTETVLAEVHGYNGHTAAWQHWINDDAEVVFNTMDPDDVYRPYRVRLDAPGKPQPLPPELDHHTFRIISPDGRYGNAHVEHHVAQTTPHGIEFDFQTGERKPLISVAEALDALPEDLRDPDPEQRFFLNHTVTSPDRSRMFFKLIRTKPRMTGAGMTAFCALMTKNLETGRVLFLGDRISGHPIWLPDSRRIVNVMSPWDQSDNRWLVVQDADTGACVRLTDGVIEGPGHPSISPDGRLLVTDAFTADRLTCPIYLLDLTSGALRETARLQHRFVVPERPKPTPRKTRALRGRPDIGRGQPHPVWSPDGRQVLVNNNPDGTHMELVVLSDLLADPATI